MSPQAASAARSRWLGFRLLALALVAGAVALMWAHRAAFEPRHIEALLADHPWAPAAFVAAHILVSLAFVPRTVMSIAAGLVFGLWWGILWTTLGSMAGAFAGFALARYFKGGGDAFERLPKLGLLMARLERGGWRAVALVRFVPIMPHTPINYAFGLTGVSLPAYLFGSFVGLMPSTVLAVDVGAAGGQALGGSRSWLEPTLIGLAALGASLLLPKLPWLRQNRT